MSETVTDPTAVVEGFQDAFVAPDLDTAVSYIAGNCEYANIPMGTVRGPLGVREGLEPFAAPIRENEFIILRKSQPGPIVFMERLDRHRLDSGRWELTVNSVFEVRHGRLAVWRDYLDLGAAAMNHDPGA
jgi:limonene-1,2-epoxide hydrolase